jgi:hypothetical protein
MSAPHNTMSNPNDNLPPPYTPPPGYTPPPPGYTPQPGFAPPSPQPQNQDFNGMLQGFIQNARRVVTQPNVASFDAAHPSANWNTVLLAVGALGVVRGITGAITAFYLPTAFLGLNVPVQNAINPVTDIIGGLIGGVIGAFIGFFVGAGILYLIARAFGGTGQFMTYSHALALAYVPLGIGIAVLGLIPILGGLAALAGGIYAIYLAILATSSTHRLTMGKSVAVVLIPAAVVAVLAVCLIALAATALAVYLHGTR